LAVAVFFCFRDRLFTLRFLSLIWRSFLSLSFAYSTLNSADRIPTQQRSIHFVRLPLLRFSAFFLSASFHLPVLFLLLLEGVFYFLPRRHRLVFSSYLIFYCDLRISLFLPTSTRFGPVASPFFPFRLSFSPLRPFHHIIYFTVNSSRTESSACCSFQCASVAAFFFH